MSSFKRRAQPIQGAPPPGTRPYPSAPSVLTVSTGIPSFDDLLGGGLPLGHVLVVLAPDPHTAYGELVQRHFIAQGLASGQRVCILDDSAMDLATSCMWVRAAGIEDTEESTGDGENSEVKIAWRYENMKKFQTSVATSSQPTDNSNSYCFALELASRIPEQVVNEAVSSKHLYFLSIPSSDREDPFGSVMSRLNKGILSATEQPTGAIVPFRISIPALGSSQWGDVSPSNILRLLHVLRTQLRGNPNVAPRACALVTLPSYLSRGDWGGPGWSQKLGWMSDACITLQSISSDPALTATFPSHHGLVTIHKLHSPHALIPASDKFSQLRGLATFSSSSIGGGENNLAFKCTRKRFVIETLHLDVEGGVSERRTTTTVPADGPLDLHEGQASAPAIQISAEHHTVEMGPKPPPVPKKRPKKIVAFQSDRPDLYDF